MADKTKPPLYICLSLDVEEEGLFSGHYASHDTSVANVERLRALAPIVMEAGFPLTLFCSYAVFSTPAACRVLENMRDDFGAEIGAHLHHWSTPPYLPEDESGGTPRRTDALPSKVLRARLKELLQKGAEFQGAPLTSFRMGRWDLKASILAFLAEAGIKVDSSICPLRSFKNGADHFLAPADPWWEDLPDGAKILEAPITQLPVSPMLARLWRGIMPKNSAALDFFHFFGALSANPLWHGPLAMRLTAKLHAMRGGQVLSFFLHSSELMPGGSPHIPDKRAADELLKKIGDFCHWLNENFNARGVTVSQLANIIKPDLKISFNNVSGDWHFQS